jgi:tetratricopeptide (TPR) repeat protein
MTETGSHGPGSSLPHQRRWRLRAAIVAGIVLVVWLLLSVRTVDPEQFGVVEGPLLGGSARLVRGGWALAPPGLLSLTRYPRNGVELPLPGADEAMLRGSDGSRFGFQGWITLRFPIENWRRIHRFADGGGVSGALLQAVRQAGAQLPSGAERQGFAAGTLARDLERLFSAVLTEQGIEMRRLELSSIDFLAMREGEVAAPTGTRLLVIGLDGGDWEIIDPLIEQGRLPNLKRLIENGARAKLLTISPMLSPVIWTTVATGVEPSRHGILDFLVEDPHDGTRQPVTSAQRRAPTVWEILSRTGVGVGVTGWWASWPADPVRGYLVSDRLAYQLFGFRADLDNAQGKTWPPDLYQEIRPLIVAPDAIGWDAVQPYLAGSRSEPDRFDAEEQKLLDEFRTLIAAGETYLRIGLALSQQFSPEFEAVYFEGTDTVGHLFMPYRLPRLPGVDPTRIESFSQIVDRYYETADAYLGRLLETRDESWTVMVLSDHGFVTDATRPRTTDSRIGHGAAADWHRRFGILVLSGRQIAPGVELEEASVYDIAPTILALFGQPIPRTWPGNVLGQALQPDFLESHPVRYRLDEPERRDRQAQSLVDPTAAALLEKLESLGYVSSDGGQGTDSLTARNNAGVAMLAEGKYAEAEQEFRAGLEATPDAPMLQLNLALTLRFQGRNEEAEPLFEQALNHPTTLRMAAHQLAQLRLDRGEIDTAEQLIRHALSREPDAAELRNTLGLILEQRGDLDGAEREFRQAAKLDPDAALARNNLGNLAKRRNALDVAESWYLRAIEADPYFMGAYNNLALVYQARAQMPKAIDLYRRALGKAPNNAVVLNNLASLYYATGDHEEARRLWSRAVTADPSYPSPLNNLASLEINAQRFVEARRLLHRALQLDPDYGDARINLSLVLRAQGQIDEARHELQLATADPRSGVNAWYQLGLFELESGNPSAAVDALEQGRSGAPRRTDLLNALGEAYLRSGDPTRAAEIWSSSLAIDPEQARVREVLQQIAGE